MSAAIGSIPSRFTSSVESFGEWLGRKVTSNPANVKYIVNFVRGAAWVPIVMLGSHAASRLLGTNITTPEVEIANREWQRLLAEEVATFSPTRKIAAKTAVLFLSIISVGILAVAVPIVEEVFFRAGVQGVILRDKFTDVLKKYRPGLIEFWNSDQGKWIRIALSTAIFVATHIPVWGVSGSLERIPIGLLFSTLYEKHGLAASIGAHALNNFAGAIELTYWQICFYWSL